MPLFASSQEYCASAGAPPEKHGRQYLHEIVANGRNGLDVDKFDYLQRDARCCGVLIAADIDRLRTFSKVSFWGNMADTREKTAIQCLTKIKFLVCMHANG